MLAIIKCHIWLLYTFKLQLNVQSLAPNVFKIYFYKHSYVFISAVIHQSKHDMHDFGSNLSTLILLSPLPSP